MVSGRVVVGRVVVGRVLVGRVSGWVAVEAFDDGAVRGLQFAVSSNKADLVHVAVAGGGSSVTGGGSVAGGGGVTRGGMADSGVVSGGDGGGRIE